MNAFPNELSASLATALDGAICEVAKECYEQEEKRYDKETWKGKVQELTQIYTQGTILSNMRAGKRIDYDDSLTVSLYLTWYQGVQVNLTLGALRTFFENQDGPIRIIDFGCGPMTTRLALVAYLAECIERKQKTPQITQIIHIDLSGLIMKIGKKLWHQFGKEISKLPSMHEDKGGISRVLLDSYNRTNRIKIECIGPQERTNDVKFISVDRSVENLLLAVHTIYKDTEHCAAITESFKEIINKATPRKFILTCHEKKEGTATNIFRNVIGADRGKLQIADAEFLLGKEIKFPKLHLWRQNLCSEFQKDCVPDPGETRCSCPLAERKWWKLGNCVYYLKKEPDFHGGGGKHRIFVWTSDES